jgi:polysaccharide biosynthesis/export protein
VLDTIPPPGGNLVPVNCRLNLRNAHSFFLARSFAMKDKDIIYIANSTSDRIDKLLGLVGLVTSPVVSGAAAYGTVR